MQANEIPGFTQPLYAYIYAIESKYIGIVASEDSVHVQILYRDKKQNRHQAKNSAPRYATLDLM